jgi:hypothetical protein
VLEKNFKLFDSEVEDEDSGNSFRRKKAAVSVKEELT